MTYAYYMPTAVTMTYAYCMPTAVTMTYDRSMTNTAIRKVIPTQSAVSTYKYWFQRGVSCAGWLCFVALDGSSGVVIESRGRCSLPTKQPNYY
jgi:hypothetical protein